MLRQLPIKKEQKTTSTPHYEGNVGDNFKRDRRGNDATYPVGINAKDNNSNYKKKRYGYPVMSNITYLIRQQ